MLYNLYIVSIFCLNVSFLFCLIFKFYPNGVQACENTENLLLVFEMLDGTQTLEGPIDHDGQSSAEGLTLLHTGGKQPQSLFSLLLFHVYEE